MDRENNEANVTQNSKQSIFISNRAMCQKCTVTEIVHRQQTNKKRFVLSTSAMTEKRRRGKVSLVQLTFTIALVLSLIHI